MALGRTRGRMSSAAMQRASQQQAMQQRAAAQRSGLRAMPQKPAAMPKQAAGQMAAFNAAQNKTMQGANMNAVAQRAMQQFNQAPAATRTPAQQAQQSPNLAAVRQSVITPEQIKREEELINQRNQQYLSNPAKMAQLAQAPNNLQTLAAKAAQPKPTPDMSAIAAPAVLSPEQRNAVMRGEKVTAPPAMRKGGAVKKKPGYAKGGVVMANCGASMKPQQKRKK